MTSEVVSEVVQQEVYERLLFLVDVQNLFYSARDAYGLASRVDFRKLKEAAIKGRKFKHIVCKAYFAAKPGEKPDEFIRALEKLYYEVELISIREHETGSPSSTNIDVVLAMDASSIKVSGKAPDIVVVASGDSDFTPVYNSMRERGIRTEILSFPGSLAASVVDKVDEVRYLDREYLFEEFDRKTDKTSKKKIVVAESVVE